MTVLPDRPIGGTGCIIRTDRKLGDVARSVPWPKLAIGLVLAYAIGAVFAFFIRWAGWWEGEGWESAWLIAVNRTVNPALDAVMLTLPWFGTNYVLAPIIILASIWLWRRGWTTVALHLLVVQLGSWALNPSLKMTFMRARPTLFEARGQHAMPAYPSGHSIASIAVLFTVAYLIHRCDRGTWAYWVVGVYAVLNAYSRLYLSVHWPTDVIGGTLVGAFWLLWTMRVFRDVHPVTSSHSSAPR